LDYQFNSKVASVIFTSHIFLFVFLPIFLAVYYLIPVSWRSFWILVASYGFYAWWRLDFLVLLVAITFFAYCAALMLEKAQNKKIRFWVLSTAVSINLVALAYFKYANFGIESLNALLISFGVQALSWTSVLLPIGLSFFIFHAISYLVDIYRNEARPAKNIIDFAAFIALYPHLIAGPVLRYHLLSEQFRTREHSWQRFSRGTVRFMAGFTKKILLADTVAPLADAVFQLSNPTFADAWLGVLAYAVQIYFDFSGYSDMAIGLALMIGFEFPENFRHPYSSRSITEFWQRWHISLSSWLREYLYIPLGGNRYGKLRIQLNLLITMVLGGLWHGANWTFIIWGAWHGGVLVFERIAKEYQKQSLSNWITIPRTFILVLIGWVFFRSQNTDSAFTILAGMSGIQGFWVSDSLAFQITGLNITMLGIAGAFVGISAWLEQIPKMQKILQPLYIPILMVLFLVSVLRMYAQNYSPFLYFQF
jgi:alginate O-acetyltransferase complex protein AlgI